MVVDGLDNLPRLCFIHIPKTAGTAVSYALREIYPKEKIFSGVFIYDYKSSVCFEKYLLYLGHLHLDFAVRNFPRDTKYITVLRNPVERILSLYFYICNDTDGILDKPYVPDYQKQAIRIAKTKGILGFIKSFDPHITENIFNYQLRVLVGPKVFCKINSDPALVVEKAWQNINKFFCYGVQEYLSKFFDELRYKLNVQSLSFKLINKNTDKVKQISCLDPRVLDQAINLIKHYNQAEIDFYEKVKRSVIERLDKSE